MIDFTLEELNEKIAEANRNLKEVEDNVRQLQKFRNSLTDQRATLNCQFNIGDLVEKETGYQKGRFRIIAIHERWSIGSLSATAIKIKKDGTDGCTAELFIEDYTLVERKDSNGEAT